MLINEEEDLMVCGEAGTPAEAFHAIQATFPDIVIIDVSLDGASGIELTRSVKAKYKSLPILVLSMHDEDLYAERAIRAGARGYVMKQEPAATVLDAVRMVLGGNVFLSNKLSSKVLRELIGQAPAEQQPNNAPGVDRLSDRELEIFELIGRGYATRRIAESLALSVKTVETHRAHIKQKLKLSSATELIHRAFHWIESGARNR